jgi:hypothetical protein
MFTGNSSRPALLAHVKEVVVVRRRCWIDKGAFMSDDPYWASLGGADPQLGPPTVANNADGSLVVFAIASDGQVYHIEKLRPAGWTTWQSLGGGIMFKGSSTGIAVGSNTDGRLEVFARGNDGNIFHREQYSPGQWSS